MIRDILLDYNKFTMNFKVLVVLIESGFIQKYLNKYEDNALYPSFLSCVLQNCERNYVKEACCRMIIRFFGPADGAGDEDLAPEKIEFINMVDVLMDIANRQKDYGPKLTALSIMALVNMCNYNEDIQSIFRLKQGFPFIRQLMKSTDDEILLNTLRLLLTNVKPKDDN